MKSYFLESVNNSIDIRGVISGLTAATWCCFQSSGDEMETLQQLLAHGINGGALLVLQDLEATCVNWCPAVLVKNFSKYSHAMLLSNFTPQHLWEEYFYTFFFELDPFLTAFDQDFSICFHSEWQQCIPKWFGMCVINCKMMCQVCLVSWFRRTSHNIWGFDAFKQQNSTW